MTGAGRRRLRSLAIFDTAFVAEVATLLGLLLALRVLAVFVQLFLDEAGTFFDFTLHAHIHLLCC